MRNDHLGRGRRCGRAQIGDEIADRDIGFVADGGNQRDLRGRDGARDTFFVERPQIFERTAAARDDDDVRPSAIAEIFRLPRRSCSTEPSPCTCAGNRRT